MYAIEVTGKTTGMKFILDSRHATKEAAEKKIDFIEHDQSYPYTTRKVVKV